jgi:hypothetical protein
MKIGVLIYTYNRIDDARINMEIIRNTWTNTKLLQDPFVVHAYDGKKKWWPKRYLEDELRYLKNEGHFAGAAALLDAGIKRFGRVRRTVDYVVVLAADTWCVKPEYIESIIRTMYDQDKYIATCSWGTKQTLSMFHAGMALDFCVIDLAWALKFRFFPLRFKEFMATMGELVLYFNDIVYLERLFALRFKQAVARTGCIPSDNMISSISYQHVHHLNEREPVIERKGTRYVRKTYWPDLGLITHHDPRQKRLACQDWKIRFGEHGNRLLSARNLEYYNSGLVRTSYSKNGAVLDYVD